MMDIIEPTPGMDATKPEDTAQNKENLPDLVQRLALHYGRVGKPPTAAPQIINDIAHYADWLNQAYRFFREASRTDVNLTYASEWVLDNFYIIRQSLREVQEQLPAGFYRTLPKISSGAAQGYPRIYAIAREILASQKYLLNINHLQNILVALQETIPLRMGEIWALPIFLRYGLIEALGQTLLQVVSTKDMPHLPDRWPITATDSPAEASGIVANTILSLRAIIEQDWADFFESVSQVESILRDDPARVYARMDFKTRDLYRKEVETLALATHQTETSLAQQTVALARAAIDQVRPGTSSSAQPLSHVGYYLLGAGRAAFEKQIHYRPVGIAGFRQWMMRQATPLYLTSNLALSALLIGLLFGLGVPASTGLLAKIAIAALLLIPVLTISANLVNWLITILLPPRIFPKLRLANDSLEPYHTLVTIPAMLTKPEDIESLARQIEQHYLRNPQKGLVFALLTDFGDAEAQTQPEDAELVECARQAIDALNRRYPAPLEGDASPDRFFLFHRGRRWNASEKKWMGWERKRGKLNELNQLLRGAQNLTFTDICGSLPALLRWHVQFIITLDADSVLPREAARRLVGTLAHPLNKAVFNAAGQVISGYTILQPRVEISPPSANRSWFTRIFAGDTGLDMYSLAVSDAYQDLFGEGIYVGKGIYDLDAFEHSVAGHIPENMLLSHDLLEGLLGRAGLATDITVIEDYPPHYFVQALRQQRWMRGDWQLLPWLLNPRRFGVHFHAIEVWKMLDNLRRSLLSPAALLAFLVGNLAPTTYPIFWTAIVFLALGGPIFTGITHSTLEALHGRRIGLAFRPLGLDVLRWLLAVAFLPYEASIAVEAIVLTLYRMFITRRNLLEWTTASQTVNLFRQSGSGRNGRNLAGSQYVRMVITILASLIVWLLVQLRLPLQANAVLSASIPIILLWIVSPLIVRLLSAPLRTRHIALSEQQSEVLRQTARRTWSFFEQFVGPEDHWLPPDHYQEDPVGIVAHHTSPTNIGLLLTATLAAYDLGYLESLDLMTRLASTFETLEKLSRYRGHFLNWYDTLTLQPLNPRYVSTVDSGNLAACLMITAQAAQAMPQATIYRWELWQGYMDTLSLLADMLRGFGQRKHPLTEALINQIEAVRKQIMDVRHDPNRWYGVYQTVSGPAWKEISQGLMTLVTQPEAHQLLLNREILRDLRHFSGQVERHHQAVQRIINELIPWIPLLENPPTALQQPAFAAEWSALRDALPPNPGLGQIREQTNAAQACIADIRAKQTPDLSEDDHHTLTQWLSQLEQALTHATMAAGGLLDSYARLAMQAEQFCEDMDFRFLYNTQRRIFHIGFNLDANKLDANFYDLLASESRITSLIAIARRQVPQSHWVHLSRPVTQVNGLRVLLSWSGTMFEYLMPPLFFRKYAGTLLEESARGAVAAQIAYAHGRKVPWGISESGFYRFDASQNYQYRAFGVPGLGFKRGLADDLVIAPYASLMAVTIAPHAVVQNIQSLKEDQTLGPYGFYEAIDYTADRMLYGEKYAVIREYMAHHQGMALLALDNFFQNDVMVRRMHADPRIQSAALLLQEQVPLAAPLLDPATSDARGVQRTGGGPVEITPWSVPAQTPIPQAHLLANDTYRLIVTNTGSGYSAWKNTDLTRWQPDGTLDPWGTWIYLLDESEIANPHGIWSAGYQPVPGDPANSQVTFFAHMAVLRRRHAEIVSTIEVTVAADVPVEIRRINLTNERDQPRRMRVSSYGEVILTAQAADTRHPAFNKLFIEEEYLPEYRLQIFRRRPRSAEEQPIFFGHMLVLHNTPNSHTQTLATHEADRALFLGRNGDPRNPQAMRSPHFLSGSTGATLDPIFALGQSLMIPAHASTQVAYLNFAADSREEILSLAQRFQEWTQIDRAFRQADLTAQSWLGQHQTSMQTLQNILQALSALLYPFAPMRAPAEILANNKLGQSGLWRFGISGDYPILLVEIEDAQQVELARELVRVHAYLHARSFEADLVMLNQQPTDYGAELNGILNRLVSQEASEQFLNQRGGIFILYTDQMPPEERTLLKTAARVVVTGEHGTFAEQMYGYALQVAHLPDFTPTREPLETQPSQLTPPVTSSPPGSLAKNNDLSEHLQFFNGWGGFSADGREYTILRQPGQPTPAPWVNVIGYPFFGFLVTEAGSQTTWAINSGENRLTPWSNDPVRDPSGEAIYLRDEETGEVWTPTPFPAGAQQTYTITHGAGYTCFTHASHGLQQNLRLFASPEDPVKIIHLTVQNMLDRPRRITATQYIEWVLGLTHASAQPYLIPEYDPLRECLLTSNPYNSEFGARTAFLCASKPLHSFTADRAEFLGRNGSMAFPAGLRRLGLERRISPGEDLCAVMQLHLDLVPGETQEIYFVLGQGKNRDEALELVDKYHEPGHVGAAWQRTHAFWEHLLDTIQVETPEPAMNRILNRWALYQALSCRIWGRTAFYQSSGAFGFRDQLQDVLAVLSVDSAIARGQILNAARRQFIEGDVLHWWHPPSGRGVRTRFSDDLLWLPYVTALYVETTGDTDIFNEDVPFLEAPVLNPGEDERYGEYAVSSEHASIFEHCRRAIEKGATRGVHGLPLIGTGDWNDGMNRVGEGGKGESIWLAWFLADVLERFAALCEQRADAAGAQGYRQQAHDYIASVEQSAWDGAWYRRAYYDDGTPLGSQVNAECNIDSIAQSWSILSGAAERGLLQSGRAQQAMQSVLDRLVHPQDRLVLLFTPPFDQTPHDPGYIKGYLPGTRENGGQYTHAATWAAWAFTGMGNGDQAVQLFNLLNPIGQSETDAQAQTYRVEPYVICADIYSMEPYLRRGGWTWYTGSAAWMYRLGLEAILGFTRRGNQLLLRPVIPAAWDGFHIDYRYGSAVYHIRVQRAGPTNPGGAIHIDGEALHAQAIPLVDDGKEHVVEVSLER